MSDKMREDFKEWARSRGVSLPVNDDIDYNDWTQLAWDAWQAARASAYTAVDMTTAAAEGFRDGVASVVVDLEPDEPADEGAAYLHQDFVKARIIAGGGSVKP